MFPSKASHFLHASHLQSLLHPTPSPASYQQLKKHLISMTNSNEQLVALNQELRYQNQYLNKQISFLNEKVELIQLENKRLLRLIEEDRILSSRSNRSLDYRSEQMKQLAELLDGGKRELEKRNEDVEKQNEELRTLNEKYKLEIIQLKDHNFELKETLRFKSESKRNEEISTGSKSDNIVIRDARFLKHELRGEKNLLLESPSVGELLKQEDISSVEGINSSQESYIKQEVIEELKHQNYLLRNQICQNNQRYETQIQKLNLYIDKLLHKQSQMQGMKATVSTLFNALTVSFIDFSNEKTQYQKKILEILSEIAQLKSKEKKYKNEISVMNNRVVEMEYQSNLLKR